MQQCPVCGMEVNKDLPAASLKFQAETYYFCSTECRDEFQRNPQKYAALAAA